MTTQEKQKLKTAMNTFKSTKRNFPLLYSQLRNDTIRAMVNSTTPNWSALRFTVTKNGI